MTAIASLLRDAAARFAARPALRIGGRVLSFAEVAEGAARAAGALEAVPRPGDAPLAVVVEPTAESVLALLGALGAGIPVLALEDSEVLGDPPRVRVCPAAVVLGRAGKVPPGIPALRAADLLAGPSADAGAHLARVDGELLQLTSGSTGVSKAAIHSSTHLLRGGEIYRDLFDVGEGDTVLATVPLAHSFGMGAGVALALCAGATLAHLPPVPPRALLQALAAARPRLVLSAPPAYDLWTRASHGQDLPEVAGTVFLSSGTALPEQVAVAFRDRFGTAPLSVYGSTEAGIVAVARPGEDAPLGSIGRPVPGVTFRLGDAGEDPPPLGTPGELWVRTETLFRGYRDEPEASARALEDGWYRTGDVASVDGAGRLSLHGRKATFVNVGGRKVNPGEVAEVLRRHPAVAHARVYGREAGAAGEHLIARVVLGGPATPAELVEWCRGRLPPYKCPLEIVVDERPPAEKLMSA